ncbi:30S ribosomal protein S17e [Candidatus Woesearchaeota archaeon]|nr:30S ribosomal protein S17e [Nanoarchaeota archaeon]MCB9370525.1 30S ribosomal protein S17e [Candidatus Woesearchaeota archaeon]USN43601.1 MAG: 30S ribosomal protein S17e [Candidatus Woesearchaeota archaeon]
MGRVKSTFVKVSAKKIYNLGKEEFTEKYEENKEVIDKYAKIPSKRLRNTIAGHITRTVKQRGEQ